MPAVLAYADGLHVVDDPLLFVAEDLEEQGGNGEAQPFDREPPPADEDPPEDAVMDVFQPGFVDHLYVYVLASAFGAGHLVISLQGLVFGSFCADHTTFGVRYARADSRWQSRRSYGMV